MAHAIGARGGGGEVGPMLSDELRRLIAVLNRAPRLPPASRADSQPIDLCLLVPGQLGQDEDSLCYRVRRALAELHGPGLLPDDSPSAEMIEPRFQSLRALAGA